MASASSPGRRGWGSGGYYADPKSPIASTPKGRKKRPAGRAYPTTPSMASLSPMKHSEVVRARRVGERGAAGDVPAGRTGGLFSPTARYDEYAGHGAAAGPPGKENLADVVPPAEAATGYSTLSGVTGGETPILAAAPEGRGPAAAAPDDTSSSSSSEWSMGAIASASSSSSSSTSAVEAAVAPEEAHPGEMSTALSEAAARDLASRVSAAQAAIEASDDWEAYEEYNPYLFIRLLPEYRAVRPRMPPAVLPRKVRGSPDISLVLDLDETLVHCSVEPIPDADLHFPVVFGGQRYDVFVRKRPFLERFLARIAPKFEVTVFTASQSVYAARLLDLIDPHGKYFTHRLYRDSCLNVDGNYIKDLHVLGRDLKKTVLVDNSQHAFGYQVDNGIPIESWFDDPDDRELLKLAWFLERELLGSEDVRPVVRRKFKVRSLVESS